MLENNCDNEQMYGLIAEWLKEYRTTTNNYRKTKAKALIVTRMLPVVKKIAKTIARRSYDPIEDMVQAGCIGLLKAIDTYSDNINDNFRIYAGYLIIGEMKHYLRDKLSAIKVPAYIQELSLRINSFINTLTVEEVNNLTNDDIAEALHVRKSEIDYAIQNDRRKSVVSLEELFPTETDSLGYEEVIAKTAYKELHDAEDMKILIKSVIERLPEEYKELVELFHYKDLNQKEIAEYLNLTQMQVSRRLKKAFSILYKMLADATIEV